MYKIFIYNRPSRIVDNMINNIENSIKQNNQISNETLNKLFEDNKKPLKYTGKTLKYISIFQYNNSNKNKEELLDTYPKLKNAKYIYPDIKELNSDLSRIGYISNASSSKVLVNKNSTWLIRIAYISGEYKYIINYFIITCFVIYWLLFGIWATINVYHKVGYKFGWTVSFFVFNIFAYMLFMFKNKTKI
ncbi:hypothetical protein ACFIJ5_07205 [Haloimpatiens sp. FM7330]|uniref:hypothetical protein n=1 Tax=Haloimpatiens sp. FM7330 TaxID=3298610 RepID=UPI003626450C